MVKIIVSSSQVLSLMRALVSCPAPSYHRYGRSPQTQFVTYVRRARRCVESRTMSHHVGVPKHRHPKPDIGGRTHPSQSRYVPGILCAPPNSKFLLTHEYDTVYAMYNRNRNLLLALSAFLVVEVGSMLGVLSVTIPEFRMTEDCVVTLTPRLFSFYW